MKINSFKRVINSIKDLKEQRPLIAIEFAYLQSEVAVLTFFLFD